MLKAQDNHSDLPMELVKIIILFIWHQDNLADKFNLLSNMLFQE
jgi:hypothetical protein